MRGVGFETDISIVVQLLLASRRGTNTVIEHREKKLACEIIKGGVQFDCDLLRGRHDSTRDVIRILSDMS